MEKKNKNKIEVGEINGRINGIELDGKNKIKGERNNFMSDDMYMPIQGRERERERERTPAVLKMLMLIFHCLNCTSWNYLELKTNVSLDDWVEYLKS